MSRREQRERMREMRELVRQRNVYRWAGRMLLTPPVSGGARASAVWKRPEESRRLFLYCCRLRKKMAVLAG